MRSLKILFLSQRFLFPMDTGGKIRTGKILEQLSGYNDITLISNIDSPKDEPYLKETEKICRRFIPVPWKETEKYSFRFFFRLFFQMFSLYPVNVLNDSSSGLREAVEEELGRNSYDVAICDFVQSALNFIPVNGVPRLLFQHNVESMIAKRHVDHASNPLVRAFWWLQWKKMFAFEKKISMKFDRVIAVSEKDRSVFERVYGLGNVHSIDTGVDIDYYRPSGNPEAVENSLIFCGSMDWLPNEDAIHFFIDEILPILRSKAPGISLTVVGRNPSSKLKNRVRRCSGVHLTGWVKDTRPYIEKSLLYIVPIRIGGGTRMKIYEAMAMEKVVISTSVGAEGLPVTNGENIFIEDDPHRFARRIVEVFADREKSVVIGKNARHFVARNFSWKTVADGFYRICVDNEK